VVRCRLLTNRPGGEPDLYSRRLPSVAAAPGSDHSEGVASHTDGGST
jgi:hypothetical protein